MFFRISGECQQLTRKLVENKEIFIPMLDIHSYSRFLLRFVGCLYGGKVDLIVLYKLKKICRQFTAGKHIKGSSRHCQQQHSSPLVPELHSGCRKFADAFYIFHQLDRSVATQIPSSNPVHVCK
jgi:hypothetical protein